MKSIAVGLLIVALGVVGYLQFVRDSSPDPNTRASVSTTSEDGKISDGKTIDLSNKALNEISKDILDNRSIVSFDVSNNNLTGSLPAEIRKLINLEELNASNNKMTGIPAEIGQLSKLRIANFADNNISGLPLEIGNLKNLETLDLRGNPNISKHDIGQIQPKIPHAKILTD